MPQHRVDLRVLAQVCAGEDVRQVAGHLLDAEVRHHHGHRLVPGVGLGQGGAEQGAEGGEHQLVGGQQPVTADQHHVTQGAPHPAVGGQVTQDTICNLTLYKLESKKDKRSRNASES